MDNQDFTGVFKSNLNFGERLSEALYFKGHIERLEQIKVLANHCGVSIKTANKYLNCEKCPYSARGLNLIKLSNFLGCSIGWLCNGDGLSPIMEKYLNAINSLPEDMQEVVMRGSLRLGIRIINNDPKVKRLMHLRDAGQISPTRFYNLI